MSHLYTVMLALNVKVLSADLGGEEKESSLNFIQGHHLKNVKSAQNGVGSKMYGAYILHII